MADGLLACMNCGKRWIMLFIDLEDNRSLGPCCMPKEKREPLYAADPHDPPPGRDWSWPIGQAY